VSESRDGDLAPDPVLARAYREAAREQPPARLDAAILAAAQREVGSRPRPAGAALRRWRLPLSLAAVIVLSVSLVTLVMEEEDALLQAPREAPAAKAPAAAPPAPAALPPAAPAVAPRVAPPASVPAAAVRSEPRAAADAGPGADAARASPPAGERAREAAAPAKAENRSAGSAAPLATPAPATPALQRSPVPAAGQPAAASAAVAALARELDNQPPERWLARIAELRREERAAEAEALLAEFHQRFPGHPLPAR
jgi:hypothetical protein